VRDLLPLTHSERRILRLINDLADPVRHDGYFLHHRRAHDAFWKLFFDGCLIKCHNAPDGLATFEVAPETWARINPQPPVAPRPKYGHMTMAALRLMRRVIEKVEAGKELTTPEEHLLSTAKYIAYQGE
jgi:hypothetical protein